MKENKFYFLCTEEEKRKLEELADSVHRNQSDTIRWMINMLYEEFCVERPSDVITEKK